MSNIKEKSERPLVTFMLLAYNQEKFICEAVEGAFAQTYEPLEIILSDDASSDKTYELIKQGAREHSSIHKVILNKNPQNLGLSDHINKVMGLVNGDLIVIAAGDDISLPSRVEKIVEVWAKNNYAPMSIHSALLKIDEDGVELGVRHCAWNDKWDDLKTLVTRFPTVEGSTHAWHRDSFFRFGPLMKELINEDMAISFRSALIGTVEYLSEPLVKYRVGVGVTSDDGAMKFRERVFGPLCKRQLIVAEQKLRDLKTFDLEHPLLLEAEKTLRRQEFVCAIGEKKDKSTFSFVIKALKSNLEPFFIFKTIVYYFFPKLSSYILFLRKKFLYVR